MDLNRVMRRWLSAAIAGGVLALVLGLLAFQAYSNDSALVKADAKGEPAREWPMFGGSLARNLVNLKETNIPTTASVEDGKMMNVKWSVDLGSKAYGGPIIAGGKIFVGTNNGHPRNPRDFADPAKKKKPIDKGILMCFDEATGSFLWQAVHDKLAAGRVNDWPYEGICSSPFVEGDRLYYVNNRSEVVCARTVGLTDGKNEGVQDEKYTDKTDADVIWRLDMIAKLNNFPHNLSTCSPLVVGDKLFIITSNGVDEEHINIPQPDAPSFIALNKKTGEVLWTNNDPTKNLVAAQKEAQKTGQVVSIKDMVNKGELLMHGQWSNPVYAEPNGKKMIIFPGGDGWMRGFNPDNGKLLWKFNCNPKDSFYVLGAAATRNDFVCTPVVWDNKLYIGVGQDPEHLKGVGHLWCIDIAKTPTNKDMDLSPVNDNFDPKAAVNKDSGLVWHYGGYMNPKPATGRDYKFCRTLSTCAVHDGLCYAADFDGHFYCLDAKTGELKYEHNMEAETWSSPYWVEGHVYIGSENGKLLIFKHGPKKELVGTIDMTGNGANSTRIRATPVACNGVLYVMTEDPCKLWAISPGGK